MGNYNRFTSYQRLTNEARKRFDLLAKRVSEAFDAEIRDCFVSEIVQEDGSRVYSSFLLLTDRGISECHSPMTEDRFDLAPLERTVQAVDVRGRDYNYLTATNESRLSVTVYFQSGMNWTIQFQAAGDGCDELKRVLREWIMPNLAQTRV